MGFEPMIFSVKGRRLNRSSKAALDIVVRTGFEPVSLKGPLKESGGQLGMGTFTRLVYSNPLEVLLLCH